MNRRFQEALRKPADTRLVSAALRRLAANGTIRLVSEGRSAPGGAVYEGLTAAWMG